jgi:hypothetical protein
VNTNTHHSQSVSNSVEQTFAIQVIPTDTAYRAKFESDFMQSNQRLTRHLRFKRAHATTQTLSRGLSS